MNAMLRLRGTLPALLVGVTVWMQPYRPGVVCGDSMSPTLKNGAVYVLDKSARARRTIRRGDVVVFRRDGVTYIKRVVGIPGDRMHVVRSFDLEMDELLMSWQVPLMRRVDATRRGARLDRVVERRIPQDFYYVVGDHMTISEDSRSFGPIPVASVLGKMIAPPPLPRMENIAYSHAKADRS